MLTMSPPRKKTGSKSPKASHILYVRISQELEDAIQAFIAAQRIPPERTTLTIKAIEELLAREGFWPPKS